MKKKTRVAYSAFMLVGGPKNVPLMLEQSGLRYATLFTTEETVTRFQQTCCSLDSYRSETLSSSGRHEKCYRPLGNWMQLARVDPPGPEVD